MVKQVSRPQFVSVYNRLREDIIHGKLTPNYKLRIIELKDKYKTSGSPVREALNRLAGEGFVNAVGQRGFNVASVSLDDLRHITRLRIHLECGALTESIEKGDDTWEANIIASFHCLSKAEGKRDTKFLEWEKCNNEFHSALISACSSPWLLRFRHTLYEQHRRYRIISAIANDASRNIDTEHEMIKDAALNRDVFLACKMVREHIQRTEDSKQVTDLIHSREKY